MTRTVDQLVDAGLVERATPREDRRQVVLTLTDQGRATCDEALRALYRLSRRLLEGVAEDDARVVARVFETVLENLLGDPALLDRLLFREPLDAAQ
jgi:MarR family transcriptional regulator for hemolysin